VSAVKAGRCRDEDLGSRGLEFCGHDVRCSMGFRIVVDAVAITGCFVHVFSFELDSIFSMSYPKVLANNGCAHRARDGTIMSGFALDVKGNTVGSFRLDLEVGWQR
jgi:hypothetical protein